MPFHCVSLITSCWQVLSTEWYKSVMRADMPHQNVSCTRWWCVWADVCNIAVLWRSPEISRTSGKTIIWTDKTGGDFIFLFRRNISHTRLFPFVFFLKFCMLIDHSFNFEAKYQCKMTVCVGCIVRASHWIIQLNHSKGLIHSGVTRECLYKWVIEWFRRSM